LGEKMIETLETLLKKHPEWKKLPIVVYRPDGTIHYVGGSGTVYPSKDYRCSKNKDYDKFVKDKPNNVLVFAPN
jgi:hypothetical protein